MPGASYFYDLYKEMYLAEDDRKDKLHARLSFPAGAITILAGVEAYYVKSAPLPQGWVSVLFLACAGALLVGIVAATVYLFRSFHDYEYAYISAASAIEQYKAQLSNYYQALGSNNIDAQVEEDTRNFLMSQYIDCYEINAQINTTRLKYLHKTHSHLIFSLVALLISLGPFYLVYKATPQVQKIEVVSTSRGDAENASGTPFTTSQAGTSKESGAEYAAPKADSASHPNDQRGH